MNEKVAQRCREAWLAFSEEFDELEDGAYWLALAGAAGVSVDVFTQWVSENPELTGFHKKESNDKSI